MRSIYASRFFLWLAFLILTAAGNAGAQVIITGAVRDNSGEALPGVTVRVKNSSQNIALTNADGRYRISAGSRNDILVFTFIGFTTQERTIRNDTLIDVTLDKAEVGLNDVVIIGYGNAKRGDLTGSVGSVSTKDLQKAPVKSFDDALAGRVAGVQVMSNDGQPGSLNNIIIRGPNSLTQENSPLYVVDGFPIENNDNNAINPADIESIDILKDASATAIYGARGANGVIMITTKRGRIGAPVISYDGYFGFQENIRKLDVLSPYEFLKLQLEIDSANAVKNYLQDGRSLESYRNDPGIDWYDKVFRAAPMQNHHLAISGGTEKSRYAISGSILDQQGIITNSGFRRYQGRVTLDQSVKERLKIGLTANYSYAREYGTLANANGGSTTAAYMYSVWSYRPVQTDPDVNIEDELSDPLINPADNYRTNPYLQAQNELREVLTSNLLANAYADYTISKHLKLRITGGVNRIQTQANAFNNSRTRTGSPQFPQSLGINGSEAFRNTTDFSNENILTYSNTFNKVHQLTVMGAYSQQYHKTSAFGAAGINLTNESLGLSGLDEGVPYSISSSSSSWALQSLLGRVNYSYRSRYMLTLSFRADGSSKFMQNNRWGYFPSGAVAYRFSSEPFMKSLKFISDAKIRVGYGATGNNRIDDYGYLSSMGFTNNFYSFGNEAPSRGGATDQLGNPNLKWETTRQFDIGLDLAFFKDRVIFTGDYYNKRTDDLLLDAQLPSVTGYPTAFKNIGKVANSGIELSLNTVNIANGPFRWTSGFNIAFNRNKVLELTENQESMTSTVPAIDQYRVPVYIAKIGQPIAQFYGVIFDGVYQYSDFNQTASGAYVLKDGVPSNGTSRTSIKPGYIKFKDLNYDGVVNNNDFTVIGDPNPDFIGGFNNNFEYAGFDLNVFFHFSYGADVMNANRLVLEEGRYPNTNQFATFAKRWTPENQDTDIPRAQGAVTSYYSSRVIEDGSFLRLKTVSLGYRIPTELLRRVKIKTLRLYVSGQNLYTWTKYSGLDPEVSVRHTALTPGYDYSPYPRARTVIFGLNATF